MKYYIIAGEASGDLHGSNLIRELKLLDKEAQFRFWGGDLMEKQGGTLVKHYKHHAFMGIFEVLLNLRTISLNFKLCHKDLANYKPDILILIDYSGFNLRIAKFAKQIGLTIYYYISPQVWAWRQSRVKTIKKLIDRMFVVLPFVKDFYKNHNYNVDFVGHPLLDAIEQYAPEKLSIKEFSKINNLSSKLVIAILPGSRKQEISKKLPIMLSLIHHYPDYQFVIAAAPSQEKEFYDKFIKDYNVHVLYSKTYSILQQSVAAIVTSGTATLETALFGVPQVVCYKAGTISYHIAKRLVKIKYISIVNLVMDKQVVKELIQDDLTSENIKPNLIEFYLMRAIETI
jgi:lipid-A-disaccharide synthase